MDKLHALSVDGCRDVIAAASEAFKAAISLFGRDPEWIGREGGYFCMADGLNGGAPLIIVPIGRIRFDKAEKYLRLSREKGVRLASHFIDGHWTSWESRSENETDEKFPGAIRLQGYTDTFSLSGLPSLGDEAVSLGTSALFYGKRDIVGVQRVAERRSDNPYIRKLLSALSFSI